MSTERAPSAQSSQFPRAFMAGSWTVVAPAAALLIVGGALAAWRVSAFPVTPDVGWYLFLSEAITGGATLHDDYWEVNPPLIVHMTRLVVAIGGAAGLGPVTAFRVFVLLAITLSAAACFSADRASGGSRRALLTALSAAFVALVLPGEHFGQRDHLLFILAAPYVIAAAAGPKLGNRFRLGAALGAGIGVSLKPHFLAVFAVVETLAMLRRRSLKPRLEAYTVVAVLVGYVASILTVDRGWMRIARLAARYYGAFAPGDRSSLFIVGAILWAVAVLYVLASSRHGRLWDSRTFVLGAAAGGLAALVAQGKGYPYHWLPLGSFGLLAVFMAAASVVTLDRRTEAESRLPVFHAGMLVTLVVVIPYLSAWAWAGPSRAWNSYNEEPIALNRMRAIAREHAAGGSVYSYWSWPGFPLVTYEPVEWASTFQASWLLPAIVRARLLERPDVSLERLYLDVFLRDLREKQPTLLFIDTEPSHARLDGLRFLDFVSDDERIARELDRYCRLTMAGRVLVLKRSRTLPEGGCE